MQLLWYNFHDWQKTFFSEKYVFSRKVRCRGCNQKLQFFFVDCLHFYPSLNKMKVSNIKLFRGGSSFGNCKCGARIHSHDPFSADMSTGPLNGILFLHSRAEHISCATSWLDGQILLWENKGNLEFVVGWRLK